MAHVVNSDICPWYSSLEQVPHSRVPGSVQKGLRDTHEVTGPDSNEEPRQPSLLFEPLKPLHISLLVHLLLLKLCEL